MQTFVLLINTLVKKTLVAMMLLIVAAVTWQVFSRFILASPSSYTEEVSRILLIWIGMLGSAYAYFTHAHLGLDLFVSKLSGQRSHLAKVCIELFVLMFALTVLVFGGLSLVSMTLELKQTSAALELQMAWVYMVIPISGGLISLYCLNNLQMLSEQREAV